MIFMEPTQIQPQQSPEPAAPIPDISTQKRQQRLVALAIYSVIATVLVIVLLIQRFL